MPVSVEISSVDPRHQPIFHFRPPSNWMNDPNGLIHWKGRYHMFYQYQADGAFHSGGPDGSLHPIVWGHAVSDDLARWEILPLAMTADPGWYDQHGVYSGCAVDADGKPVIIYTGNQALKWMDNPPEGRRYSVQTPLLAWASADLSTLTKRSEPIIPSEPEGFGTLTGFRDHRVWREDGVWHQLIGSGVEGKGGVVFHYKSTDLENWEFAGPLLEGTGDDPWEPGRMMWECPDFFEVGERRMLIVSNCSRVIYWLGEMDGDRFVPDEDYPDLLDLGMSFYAPQSFADAEGRRIQFGWLREARPVDQQIAAGWSGVMSLPWVIDADEDGELRIVPAPEIEALRGVDEGFDELELSPSCPELRLDFNSDAFEMDIEFEPQGARTYGVKVLASADGREVTRIVFDDEEAVLTVEREKSSLADGPSREAEVAELDLDDDENLRMRVFVDRSVIEIFINERAVLSTRVYPTLDDATGVEVFCEKGSVSVPTLDLWQMRSIW